MTSLFSAITPSDILTSGPITSTGAAIDAAPVAIQTARGLFMLEIVDVAAADTMRVTIAGGFSRQFGNPSAAYAVQSNSGLNSNVTVNNVGTVTAGASQTTMVVTNTATTTEYTLVYIPSVTGSGTNAPTIEITDGAVPAGNVNISTTYLNCGP